MRYALCLLASSFLPSAAVANSAAPVADLCAPCVAGDQCIGTLCALDANGAGICSQACQANKDCPAAFTCQLQGGVCAPSTAASCPAAYVASVNLVCQFPPADSSGTAFTRNCAAGLICYTNFPADSSGSSVGVCVEACSTVSGGPVCPFGDTCCYSTATDSSCTTTSSSSSYGGCFDIGDTGDLCSDNNKAYCLPGASCVQVNTPTAKYCYDVCDEGLCYEGGVCESIAGQNLCCDKAKYIAGNEASCVPGPSLCRRQVGVTCSTNAQCRQGYCLKSRSQGACTAPCTTDADCPDASADINADGRADGGSTCQLFGTEHYCWPTSGPAAAPACASVTLDLTPVTQSGCHCATGSKEGSLAALGLVLLRLRRSWRRARRA